MNNKLLESPKFKNAMRNILSAKMDREVSYVEDIAHDLSRRLTMRFWLPLQRQLIQDFYSQISPNLLSNLRKLINKTEK